MCNCDLFLEQQSPSKKKKKKRTLSKFKRGYKPAAVQEGSIK